MSSSSLHTLVITLTLTHKTHVQMHTYTTQARKERRKGGKNIGHPTERRPVEPRNAYRCPWASQVPKQLVTRP